MMVILPGARLGPFQSSADRPVHAPRCGRCGGETRSGKDGLASEPTIGPDTRSVQDTDAIRHDFWCCVNSRRHTSLLGRQGCSTYRKYASHPRLHRYLVWLATRHSTRLTHYPNSGDPALDGAPRAALPHLVGEEIEREQAGRLVGLAAA